MQQGFGNSRRARLALLLGAMAAMAFSVSRPVCAQQVDLTSDVQGILPVANGGTGINATGQTGCLTYSNGTPAIGACGGTAITLQTNGIANGSQSLLNLTAGAGISLSNSGGITTLATNGVVLENPASGVSQTLTQLNGSTFSLAGSVNATVNMAGLYSVPTAYTTSIPRLSQTTFGLGSYAYTYSVSASTFNGIDTFLIGDKGATSYISSFITPCSGTGSSLDSTGIAFSQGGSNYYLEVCGTTEKAYVYSITGGSTFAQIGSTAVSSLLQPCGVGGIVFDPLISSVFVSCNPSGVAGYVVKISVATPASPTVNSSVITPANVSGSYTVPVSFVVGGDFLFMDTPGTSTGSVQVANKNTMTLVGSPLVLAHSPQQIAIAGNVLFVGQYDNPALVSIDASNPAALTVIQNVTPSDGCYFMGQTGMTVSGKYLFASCSWQNAANGAFDVWDVSNPAQMYLVASYTGYYSDSPTMVGRYFVGANSFDTTNYTVGILDTGGVLLGKVTAQSLSAPQLVADLGYIRQVDASTVKAGDVVAGTLTDSGVTGSSQCAQFNSAGQLSGTGAACGGGSGTVGAGTVDGVAYYNGTTAVGSTTAPTTSGHIFADAWQPTGSAIAPAPYDMTANMPFLASANTFTATQTAPTFKGTSTVIAGSSATPPGIFASGVGSTACAICVIGMNPYEGLGASSVSGLYYLSLINSSTSAFALYLGKQPNSGSTASNSDWTFTPTVTAMSGNGVESNGMAFGWGASSTGAGTVGTTPTLNAGFSNPSAGVVSCDTSTAGNASCSFKAGSITANGGSLNNIQIGGTTAGPGTFTSLDGTNVVVSSTLQVGGSQSLTSVQGTAGTKIAAASGTFTNGNLRATNSTGDEVDGGAPANGALFTVQTVSVTAQTFGAGTCNLYGALSIPSWFTSTSTVEVSYGVVPSSVNFVGVVAYATNDVGTSAGIDVCNLSSSSITTTGSMPLIVKITY